MTNELSSPIATIPKHWDQLVKDIEKHDWCLDRITKSHHIFTKPNHRCIPLAFHGGGSVSPHYARLVLEQAGLGKKDYTNDLADSLLGDNHDEYKESEMERKMERSTVLEEIQNLIANGRYQDAIASMKHFNTQHLGTSSQHYQFLSHIAFYKFVATSEHALNDLHYNSVEQHEKMKDAFSQMDEFIINCPHHRKDGHDLARNLHRRVLNLYAQEFADYAHTFLKGVFFDDDEASDQDEANFIHEMVSTFEFVYSITKGNKIPFLQYLSSDARLSFVSCISPCLDKMIAMCESRDILTASRLADAVQTLTEGPEFDCWEDANTPIYVSITRAWVSTVTNHVHSMIPIYHLMDKLNWKRQGLHGKLGKSATSISETFNNVIEYLIKFLSVFANTSDDNLKRLVVHRDTETFLFDSITDPVLMITEVVAPKACKKLDFKHILQLGEIMNRIIGLCNRMQHLYQSEHGCFYEGKLYPVIRHAALPLTVKALCDVISPRSTICESELLKHCLMIWNDVDRANSCDSMYERHGDLKDLRIIYGGFKASFDVKLNGLLSFLLAFNINAIEMLKKHVFGEEAQRLSILDSMFESIRNPTNPNSDTQPIQHGPGALVFATTKGLLELKREDIQLTDVSNCLEYIVKNRSQFPFTGNMSVKQGVQHTRNYFRTILRFHQAIQNINMNNILKDRSESVGFLLERLQESIQSSFNLYTLIQKSEETGYESTHAEVSQQLKEWTCSEIRQVMIHWTQLQTATEAATRIFHSKTGSAYPLVKAVFSTDWRIREHQDLEQCRYKNQDTVRAIHNVEVVNAILYARKKIHQQNTGLVPVVDGGH